MRCLRPAFAAFVVVLTLRASASELFIPYTMNSGGFSTELVLHNQLFNATSRVEISVAGSDRALAAVTLGPRQTRVVELDAPANVPVVIRHDGVAGSVNASALIVHRRDRLSWRVPAVRRDFVFGTQYAAVLWYPDATTTASVAITNATGHVRSIRLTASAGGAEVVVCNLSLRPFENSIVDLDSALAPAQIRSATTGLKLEHDGAPGDVLVDGVLSSHATGFTKRISFIDLAHGDHDRRLRASFVLLGTPPPSFSFSTGTVFRPVCAIYNPAAAATTITPVLHVTDRTIDLPPISVAANATALLDLAELQRRGLIPPNAGYASLELPYAGSRVVAELTDLDVSTGYRYNVGSSMNGHLSEAVESAFWRADGRANTLVSLTNAAPFPDTFEITVNTSSATRTIEIDIEPGVSRLLNLRELGVGEEGVLSVRGRHGIRSSFFFEQLLVNASLSSHVDADDEMSELDEGGDIRVMRISADAVLPSEGDPSPSPVTVSFGINVNVYWTDGHMYTDAGTDFATTDPHLTADELSQTGSAFVDGSDWDGNVFVFFIDPCFYSLQYTSLITVSIRHSAYEYNGIIPGLIYDQCLWRATCTGTCSTSGHVSVKVHGLEPCFDPGQPYLQFIDLRIGSECLRKVFGGNTPVPGFCN